MPYLGNALNLVRDADLTMTNTVESSAIARVDVEAKEGGGTVRVTGPYTGGVDALVDIEVTDATPEGVPSSSAAAFVGVGNGTLTGIAADAGTPSGRIIVTVEDLGTETRAAIAFFQGARLRAKPDGDVGNDTVISVTRALVRTGTDYSLRDDLAADATDLVGDHWAFGAVQLNLDGTLPPNAPRISIGDDPAVFRQYRKFEGGRYTFGFSPRPPRTIGAGARVYSVTGGYTITITRGATVEVLPPVVTLFEALDAMRTASALIVPEDVVVNDMRPGGMAAVDVDVWTQAYCAQITRDGGAAMKRAEIGLQVAANAPLENLTIECIDAGRQLWDVRGPVSGILAQAITGVLYEGGAYQFLIPAPPTDPATTGVSIFVELDTIDRDGGSVPQLCNYRTAPGINARNGTFEFVWQLKPTAPCPCDDVVVTGGPSPECLGTDELPGGTNVSEASRLRRLQRVTAWLREFISQNTYLFNGYGNDIAIARRRAEIYLKCLTALDGGKLDYPGWTAGKVYKLDEIIEPSPANGFRYAITAGGTSHSTPPTFPTTIGNTVTDGAGVVYECIGLKPLAMWDAGFEQLQREMQHLFAVHGTAGADSLVWFAGRTMLAGGPHALPTTPNGHYYRGTSSVEPYETGSTEPTWPTDGGTVTDGDVVWKDMGPYGGRANSTSYAAGQIVYSVYHGALECLVGGETAASVPAYANLYVNDTFEDGEVTWKIVSQDAANADGTAAALAPDVFYSRDNAIANDVLAAAGLQGNFKSPGRGDSCWAEIKEHLGWFVYNGSDSPPYLPLQHSTGNHSSKPATVDGQVVFLSTHEWWITLPIACANALLPGDKVRVTVSGATGATGGYQVGDRFTAAITAGAPLAFNGGQAGTDTLTCSVFFGDERLPDYSVSTTAPLPYRPAAWASGVAYAAGARVRPTVANGYVYTAQGAGTSAGPQPTWPTTIDATVVDAGGFTWRCTAVDPGIDFLLTQGGIPYALGDVWSWSFEGGHFRWRVNGGAWTSNVPIAPTVSLVDGLVANFTGGGAPSWVAPDAWIFRAEALNGADNLRRPTGGRARWTSSTTINITPTDGAMHAIYIADHEIPSNATIRLQGSNDAFASPAALDVVIPWAPRDIYTEVEADYAVYRLTVDTGGSIFWLWADSPLMPTIETGVKESGRGSRIYRIASRNERPAVGGPVRHEAITHASWEAMRAMLDYAGENDAGRFGFVSAEGTAGIVTLADNSVSVTDLHDFQPDSIGLRYLTIDLDLVPL